MKTFEIIKVDPQGYCGGVFQAIAIAKKNRLEKHKMLGYNSTIINEAHM